MGSLENSQGHVPGRDPKAALVLFIDRADVTSVIRKAEAMLAAHPRYKRTVASPGTAGIRRYVFHQEGDPARELQLALVPVPVRE